MPSLKKALTGKLTPNQLERLRTSFDVIGDICIIEVPRELENKERVIASTLLKINSQFRVVAKKKGGHAGRYRAQQLKVLAIRDAILAKASRVSTQSKANSLPRAQSSLQAQHKEWGLVYHLDVGTCYFSPRLGTERMRITRQVQSGENVLVLFSGVGPYVLHLAKHSQVKRVTGMELNPSCHKYALQNALANKLQHKVILIKGNANKVANLTKDKFDRIIMPLPKSANRYLKAALSVAKSGAFLHYYTFAKEDEFEKSCATFARACKKHGRECTILRVVSTGQNAPRQHRVCVDAVLDKE